jgi:hypothetical protein
MSRARSFMSMAVWPKSKPEPGDISYREVRKRMESAFRMKLQWPIAILPAGTLAVPVIAQDNRPQPKLPFSSGVITSDPSANASPELPDGPQDPQLTLKQYEQQMAVITVQTYEELGQIAQAVRAGQMSGEQGWYLAGQRYEVGVIRLQFFDTLHQIIEANIRTGHKSENQEKQAQEFAFVPGHRRCSASHFLTGHTGIIGQISRTDANAGCCHPVRR